MLLMDTVKININTPVYGDVKLNVESIIEDNEELRIKLSDKMCYSIDEGDKLYFSRKIYGEKENLFFNDFVIVKNEDEDHVLHTTLLKKNKFRLDKNFFKLKYTNETSYYVITCIEPHFIFGQDLFVKPIQEVYFKKNDGTLLGKCSGIKPYNIIRGDELTKEDCIVKTEYDYTCGKKYEYIEKRYYNFFPKCASKNSFILTDFNEIIYANADYIEFKFNPFYYYYVLIGGIIPNADSGDRGTSSTPIEPLPNIVPAEKTKTCYFYGDLWFDSFVDTLKVKYINESKSKNGLYNDMNYYSIGLGISTDVNESNLGVEDYFSEKFAKDVEESMTPDFIDMERVKYVPVNSNDNTIPLTALTIYPHFRKRVRIDPLHNENTYATSGNLYCDGWYIDTEDEDEIYWNNSDILTGDGVTNAALIGSINNFVDNKGKISDLIGFLNFNDNDIYYKKEKVSKSFFRFSFYDSNVPIEQKLLYYSTVFLDSTDLYCKFLKQNAFIRESDEADITINEYAKIHDEVNETIRTVFCENEDVNCKLTSTIFLTNEYNKEKSAEGFNLYLFADDAPEGNEEKTIYMKVEFNHAGNGKTIPMIIMPRNELLTIKNFINYLFIPIKIKKMDDKYVYSIVGAKYETGESDRGYLCLYEPKLEMII